MDIDEPGAGEGTSNGNPSSSGRRVRKAKAEVKWYLTSLEVEKGQGREEVYGWSGVGGELSYTSSYHLYVVCQVTIYRTQADYWAGR